MRYNSGGRGDNGRHMGGAGISEAHGRLVIGPHRSVYAAPRGSVAMGFGWLLVHSLGVPHRVTGCAMIIGYRQYHHRLSAIGRTVSWACLGGLGPRGRGVSSSSAIVNVVIGYRLHHQRLSAIGYRPSAIGYRQDGVMGLPWGPRASGAGAGARRSPGSAAAQSPENAPQSP
jgi:hypothetical protein